MATEQSKIFAMLEGKTLEKDNIKKMYQMVQSAQDPEMKKNVMKHSVFFVGQLPLAEHNRIDLVTTRRILNTTVSYEELDEYMNYLLEGLSTQKLILQKDDGSYEVNMKYEKSIVKVRKIAKAYQLEKAESLEEELPRAKKMYQMGTKHYNIGNYEEAAACFLHAVDAAEYRMAYYSLALLYKDGKGVEKSLTTALYFVRNALVRGAMLAEPLEQELLALLNPEA